ncbi:DsrE/DsrF family oxidoreductase family protein [Rippkaea orientalis PCC 8801]|uniref:DsrE/DsrF family oxidoreductase family protein n=1 Tax=Rippkaea orientalis (strain PCC 8801 / RF-1) TaxID=41431 RepID=B7K599_RIPO1|nr:DsrE family protein [Rippkaea orientalis]ACK67925.1 DsrE/DsrF family oxidoreductase family protein [Rippkaea orientalis PCC 8801]
MSQYFLIESKSPFESTEVKYNYQLASDLAKSGHEVTLFLVENGVLATRSSIIPSELVNISPVKVLADDFSLEERGIEPAQMSSTIQVSNITSIVEAMGEGQKTLWL